MISRGLKQTLLVNLLMPLVFSTGWAATSATPAPAQPAPATTSASEASEKTRSRLDELFIWKASEELKLQPEQEQKFTEIIRELGARKRQASARMEKAVAALDAAKGKAEAEKAVANLREVINEYHAIQLAEVDRLKPLMGPEKLARYFVVKDQLSAKLKQMISAPAASPVTSATPATK